MPRTLLITPLVEPTLDRVGFPLDHPYIEQVWLSALGPSSVLCLRHLGRALDAQPAGVAVDLVDLSRSLGLQTNGGEELGRSARVVRTLDRLVQFGFAEWASDDRLGLHRRAPAMSAHRVGGLPGPVQDLHHQLLTEHLQSLGAAVGTRAASTTPAQRLATIGHRAEPVGRGISR